MKCPNCGAEIGVNSKFCESCGSQISYEMKREQELLNKKGCPKCGSSNVVFNREEQGYVKGGNGTKVIRHTVGVCKDCGNTWYTDNSLNDARKTNEEVPTEKSKTWLWVLGWICFFPAPIMVLIWRKKNTWDVKVKLAVTAAFWILVFALGSQNNETSENNNPGTAAQEETVKEETHIYDSAEIIDIMSGSGNNKIGTMTLCHANKEDCTDEVLADWYINYVKNNSDAKFHVIIYDNVADKGVYTNGMGFIQKDITLTKDNDGTYELGDDAGSTYYTVNDDGSLKVQSIMADESVTGPIKEKVEAIIPDEYKNSDFYSVDITGSGNSIDCNLTLVSDSFKDADLQTIAVELGTQIKALDLGINYFSIAFQKDDYTLTAVSSINDLSTQDTSDIKTTTY